MAVAVCNDLRKEIAELIVREGHSTLADVSVDQHASKMVSEITTGRFQLWKRDWSSGKIQISERWKRLKQ
jgi:hypothetical protein